ncbi:hypothetical protein SAMN02799624_04501 [Paenibacillus sp. UNC496MF]|uniref:serine/threonine-protein kinase n=1 Tax=Paenibacillus sp. UNC496MF TaxID=1502753 RepID=UPI0008EFA28D|nr:serine/threonine-protein kinase [Paenibacillus sp. UNC496MF]SFJ43531.1 hypothetical protein SAMN02799624_04501 [Paenibacillus sp. UNC496MF]
MPRLLNHFPAGDGYALVFEWVDGEVPGSPEFSGKEGRSHPDSPHFRFRRLPAETIVRALGDVCELHEQLERLGYVAVDLYGGSLIYDFARNALPLCDFDLYAKGAFTLATDRNYGSSRYMAPEEFVKGSRIDGVTNVFNLGASAFVFLAEEEGSRESAGWRASGALHRTALKAHPPTGPTASAAWPSSAGLGWRRFAAKARRGKRRRTAPFSKLFLVSELTDDFRYAYNRQQHFNRRNATNRSSRANAGNRELRDGATQPKAA